MRSTRIALLLGGLLALSSCVLHSESRVEPGETVRDPANLSEVGNLKYDLFSSSHPESDTTLAQEVFRGDQISFWKLEDLNLVCLGAVVNIGAEDPPSTQVDLGSGQTLLSKCVNEDVYRIDGVLLDASANERRVTAFMRTSGSSIEAPTNFEEVAPGLFLVRL